MMIAIISGTNREPSMSKEIALFYQKILAEFGSNTDIIDLGKLPTDFLNVALYKNSGKSDAFNPMRIQIKMSAKMIFIVPEYNGSFPGVLKAFIDALEFPNTFKNKKCALIGLSSGSQGGGLALSHLTDILNYCGANVLAQKPRLARIEASFQDGEFSNPTYLELLKEQAQAFLDF